MINIQMTLQTPKSTHVWFRSFSLLGILVRHQKRWWKDTFYSIMASWQVLRGCGEACMWRSCNLKPQENSKDLTVVMLVDVVDDDDEVLQWWVLPNPIPPASLFHFAVSSETLTFWYSLNIFFTREHGWYTHQDHDQIYSPYTCQYISLKLAICHIFRNISIHFHITFPCIAFPSSTHLPQKHVASISDSLR